MEALKLQLFCLDTLKKRNHLNNKIIFRKIHYFPSVKFLTKIIYLSFWQFYIDDFDFLKFHKIVKVVIIIHKTVDSNNNNKKQKYTLQLLYKGRSRLRLKEYNT